MNRKPYSKTWISTQEALIKFGFSLNSYDCLLAVWKKSKGIIERRKPSHKVVQWGLESIELYLNSTVLGGENIRKVA